ncbi:MAG: hypothetical protein ONB23_07750 [candidate division KSB1 bacterium]|nr:hypothetical protein [candidate division KSB1 bacterium]
MASAEERRAVLEALRQRYGLPAERFNPYELVLHGRNIWMVRRSPHLAAALDLAPHTVGLRLATRTNIGLKPSTHAIQIFGRWATRNVARLSRAEALSFLNGQDIARKFEVEPGFVIVACENEPIGCGLYKGTGVLKSLVPKRVRQFAPDSPET